MFLLIAYSKKVSFWTWIFYNFFHFDYHTLLYNVNNSNDDAVKIFFHTGLKDSTVIWVLPSQLVQVIPLTTCHQPRLSVWVL